ncbi:RIP metalloprotease RseP [Thioclava sp. FR2]|uniref:RIP metalloprotease RseP n=1 Tax=Thioclava sp. FR2 TaxID=3445780 RepID=UPI003EB78FF1
MDLIGLFPSFGNAIWTIAAFVVALSVIVAIHEYGHYIVGRWSGIHAEVFSLGFGPVLFSREDQYGTRWQLAALPFGGYVKFLGDSNAASGVDGQAIREMTAEERRRTMHGAPLWARAATVAAGPMFNFISAIIIFAAMSFYSGIATEDPVISRVEAVPFSGPTLEVGDRVNSINDVATPDFTTLVQVARDTTAAPTASYEVVRNGETLRFDGPHPYPPVALSVSPHTAAYDAGMQTADVITAINGQPIYSFIQLQEAVKASDGAPVALTIWRAGETVELTLEPRRSDMPLPEGGFETRWLIGLTGGMGFDPVTRLPSPIEAVQIGAEQTWYIAKTSLSGIWHMITGAISSCNLRSPIGIAESSGAAASQGVDSFIMFIGLLSVAVGLMNLLPVPVLDGGHLVFHAYEAIFGNPPTEKALRVLMSAGLTLILSLMAFGVSNDLFLC